MPKPKYVCRGCGAMFHYKGHPLWMHLLFTRECCEWHCAHGRTGMWEDLEILVDTAWVDRYHIKVISAKGFSLRFGEYSSASRKFKEMMALFEEKENEADQEALPGGPR